MNKGLLPLTHLTTKEYLPHPSRNSLTRLCAWACHVPPPQVLEGPCTVYRDGRCHPPHSPLVPLIHHLFALCPAWSTEPRPATASSIVILCLRSQVLECPFEHPCPIAFYHSGSILLHDSPCVRDCDGSRFATLQRSALRDLSCPSRTATPVHTSFFYWRQSMLFLGCRPVGSHVLDEENIPPCPLVYNPPYLPRSRSNPAPSSHREPLVDDNRSNP